MKLINDTGKWDFRESYKGRYKKCVVNVVENNNGKFYFYTNNEARDIRYNSLWNAEDNVAPEYDTKEECANAACRFIDSKIKKIKN